MRSSAGATMATALVPVSEATSSLPLSSLYRVKAPLAPEEISCVVQKRIDRPSRPRKRFASARLAHSHSVNGRHSCGRRTRGDWRIRYGRACMQRFHVQRRRIVDMYTFRVDNNWQPEHATGIRHDFHERPPLHGRGRGGLARSELHLGSSASRATTNPRRLQIEPAASRRETLTPSPRRVRLRGAPMRRLDQVVR
jgi:hypothetical protein